MGPGSENELSKRGKKLTLKNYLDPKYRGIGAKTKMGVAKVSVASTGQDKKFYGSRALYTKVLEDEKMALLKEIDETSKVIYSIDKDDPSNPEILVKGLGRYKLKSAKQDVRNKLADMAKTVAETDDPYYWRQAAWMLNNAALRELMSAIVAAHDELQAIRKKGGPRSRGIDKE